MKKIAIIPDPNKKKALKLAVEVFLWLTKNYNISAFLLSEEGARLQKELDLAIPLGGDGFITRKSLELAHQNIPFAAVNFGAKGFLAVAERKNWQAVLEKVIDGKYVIEKRLILAATCFSKKEARNYEAAANVYIRHKTDLIRVRVSIDGKPVYKTLRGDGVIVATTTGATAYNLGAGGPIISNGMVITPICAYAMNVKPLPVSESKRIEIVYLGRKSRYGEDEGCYLSVDGKRCPIEPGDRIEIQKSPLEASFIIPEGFSFIESLQKKLGLST